MEKKRICSQKHEACTDRYELEASDNHIQRKEEDFDPSLHLKEQIPKRFNHPDWFGGFGGTVRHPAFDTTNNQYGLYRPSVHSQPLLFFPRNHKFSSMLARGGPYRNTGLNTGVDRHPVIDL